PALLLNGPPIKAGPQIQRENVNNMPESFRETETEESGRNRQQRDQENQKSRNVVSVISQLVDDNLTLVRNISTGLAVAGVIVIARSIRVGFLKYCRSVSFHLSRSQNFKVRLRSLFVSLRGTSAFEEKFIPSQKEELKWSTSRFISQSSLHYCRGTAVMLG
ncbi:hypothetical protein GOODEAATRI_032727, partial [Goodea atripinnis]